MSIDKAVEWSTALQKLITVTEVSRETHRRPAPPHVIFGVLGLHSGKECCLGNEAKTDALNGWSFMAVPNVSQLLWAGLLGDLSVEESVDIVALVVLISSKAFQVIVNETMSRSRALK